MYMYSNDKKNKYICIHGHFYQPPRENAWLEVIETQDSANPFHDWNERINFESYAPNATARILDDKGFIKNIVNNYSKINFNIGPTLLSWLEAKDAETYRLVLEADKIAQTQFGGHGTAIARANDNCSNRCRRWGSAHKEVGNMHHDDLLARAHNPLEDNCNLRLASDGCPDYGLGCVCRSHACLPPNTWVAQPACHSMP